jgi:hypothetical protein
VQSVVAYGAVVFGYRAAFAVGGEAYALGAKPVVLAAVLGLSAALSRQTLVVGGAGVFVITGHLVGKILVGAHFRLAGIPGTRIAVIAVVCGLAFFAGVFDADVFLIAYKARFAASVVETGLALAAGLGQKDVGAAGKAGNQD